jgi:iron-sulfur cluster repair protein YtfE (RIC family)
MSGTYKTHRAASADAGAVDTTEPVRFDTKIALMLRDDLEPHLMKEEQVLFPMIRELAAATTVPTFHCGTLANPIRMMLLEHDRAGELLADLRPDRLEIFAH